jgi:hypothetical protein
MGKMVAFLGFPINSITSGAVTEIWEIDIGALYRAGNYRRQSWIGHIYLLIFAKAYHTLRQECDGPSTGINFQTETLPISEMRGVNGRTIQLVE